MFLPLKDDNELRFIAFQWVTVPMIVVCAVVLALEYLLSGDDLLWLQNRLGVVPSRLLSRDFSPLEILTLFSYMFVHTGWWHLLGNMLFLWVFGDNVEDSMGHLRYLGFYLVTGALAGLLQCLAQPGSEAPVVGASGAVSGVLGAYLVLHPRVRVLVLAFKFLPVRIPVFLLLPAWVLLQVVNALSGRTEFAWWAHLGGFGVGVLLVLVLRKRTGASGARVHSRDAGRDRG